MQFDQVSSEKSIITQKCESTENKNILVKKDTDEFLITAGNNGYLLWNNQKLIEKKNRFMEKLKQPIFSQ